MREPIIRHINQRAIERLRGRFNCELKISKKCTYDNLSAIIDDNHYWMLVNIFFNEIKMRNIKLVWVEE